jgi:hypothetical protein
MNAQKARILACTALRAKRAKKLATLRKFGVVIGGRAADCASSELGVGERKTRESREHRGKCGGMAGLVDGGGGVRHYKKSQS